MKLIRYYSLLMCFSCFFPVSSQEICDENDWISNYIDELHTDIVSNEIKSINELDFGSLLLEKQNAYLGFVGVNKRRLKISFKSSKKVKENNKYLIEGKTIVGKNDRDFEGYIIIKEVCSFKNISYGVDDWMKGKVKSQGITIANFNFLEDSKYSSTGVFKGKLIIRWYINMKDELKYDDINNDSDSYSNNLFLGFWTSYKTKKSIQCAWGQYRIPCSGDLDIGAAEFFPNNKYIEFGWKDYLP